MIREPNCQSPLAVLAAALPVRARACLALLAADMALHHLRTSPEFNLARDGLNLALKWHQGESVDPDKLGEALEAEESGIAFAMLRAEGRSQQELLAWYVLGNAIYYSAYHAFRAANRNPWGSIGEVNEGALDHLDRDLRALEPSSMARMTRAAAYLKRYPNAPLSRVEAHIFSGGRTGHV